jgi:mRNA interferase RelE/StbE
LNWVVRLSPKAEKEILAIHGPDRARIEHRLLGLGAQVRPVGDGKLKDSTLYRLRVGDWRVIYEIDDGRRLLLISRVLRRSEKTYRDF